ncbi:MAG: outer membrane beta-barrel protein [Gemmatimonadetes bacterium]|uniref:Outer membrane beta-barrel protein n=1 Tax=Candidatus Kutchimonas denitrificans TaxID=3056748 RepID=A0AAE5CBL5_9BACT|nr:outer membrane beta-barrel protein [Gemmatimonadota bacterium]NIR76037.1 outer membrane beta-barrel protein [Candidatus Kutchimonas denitrificans]NIS02229.1 outer membrane beta-barrel protein [Gemmatimonadota bacterium]NIT68055.1 outer membrane beta-barrel protein [Gemmatimonadota bacterium]NIU54081.1 outer membrane beta-barrel protein [Gemmatimonadota bacterium]
MPRFGAAVIAVLLALSPSAVAAQQFTISGFGGAFLPAADLTGGSIFFEPGEIPDFAGEVATAFRHQVAFNFGGRIGVWPTQRLGFEAEAAYALSDADLELSIPFVRDPGPPIVLGLQQETATLESNVFMGSVNVLYALIRPPLEPLVVFVSAGAGFVNRGGDLSDIFDSTTDVAFTWGFGIKYGIARGVWLRGDVRDYISKFSDPELDDEWQNDLLVNAGLEVSFGG